MANDAGVRSIDDLKSYGRALADCSEALRDTSTDVLSETHRVCEGWNDKNAQHFVDEMSNKVVEIQKLSDIMIQFSEYIKKQCDVLEEYERNLIR